MKITRLHMILIAVILFTIGVYVYQIMQSRLTSTETPAAQTIAQPQKAEEQKIEIDREKLRQEAAEKKKDLAIQAIAVAGEYRILKKQEGMDVAKGQATLHHAKEYLQQNNFDTAWELAHQAIKEFKEAPSSTLYYKTKRGDCLWNIAKLPQHYGRGSMWVKIWRANKNKIPDFDLIYSGQKLLIPKG